MSKVHLIESPYALDKIKGIGPKRLALLEELNIKSVEDLVLYLPCLLYTSPSPRDQRGSRMPSSA